MDNLKNLNTVTQTNESNDEGITDDTTQLATMDNLQNSKESTNSVTNYATIKTSVTCSKSPKTFSGQIKPPGLGDDSVNMITSFIQSDQEEKKNNEILKKTKNTEDKLKSDHEEQHNTTTQRNLEIHSCCIPGCIYHDDYLNESTNAKPESIAIFTPSSVENMNEWSSALGLHLTMKSRVCERHFKSEDVILHGISTSGADTSEVKSLKYGAVPLKIQKYGKTLKMHGVNNGHENIAIKRMKKNADESKTFSHFGELSENENIKMVIENDPPIYISNSTFNINNESRNSLSNMTSNSSIENNSLSSLEELLPKMSAKNSLTISIQPSVQQSKQVLITESIKVTDAIDSLNHNKKPVEELFNTSQNNSIQTNLLLNFGLTDSKKLTNNGYFSITAEKNNDPSAKISSAESTEVTNPSSEVKPNSFDDIPQTISTNSSEKVKFSLLQSLEKNIYSTSLLLIKNPPSTSSGPSISTVNPNKFNFKQIITTSVLKDSASTSSELNIKEHKPVTHDIPQTTTTDSPDKVNFSQKFNIQNLFSINPLNNPAPANFGQSNNENKQMPPNEVHIDITVLNSFRPPDFVENYSDSSQSSDDNFSSRTSSFAEYKKKQVSTINSDEGIDSTTKLEPTDDILQTSVNESSFEQPGITRKEKLSFQSNFSNRILNKQISHKRDRVALKKFLKNSKNVIRPNEFWKYFYSSRQNSALFVFQKDSIMETKRIYFDDSYIPDIYIKGIFYSFQKAIKTISDLQNLLEEVDDIKICFGNHVACIGYFENNSEGIEACRNCRNLKKSKSLPIADEVL